MGNGFLLLLPARQAATGYLWVARRPGVPEPIATTASRWWEVGWKALLYTPTIHHFIIIKFVMGGQVLVTGNKFG